MNDGGETAGSELRLRAEVQLRRYDCVADISKALYLKNRILEEETKNSLLLWLYTRPALLRSLLCEHGWTAASTTRLRVPSCTMHEASQSVEGCDV